MSIFFWDGKGTGAGRGRKIQNPCSLRRSDRTGKVFARSRKHWISESSAPAPLPSPFLFPGGAGCLWRLTYGFPPSSFTFVLAPSTYRKTCLPAADADTRFCSPQHGMTPAIVYGFPPSAFRPPRTEKRACPRPVVYSAGRQEGVWFQESRACDCGRTERENCPAADGIHTDR